MVMHMDGNAVMDASPAFLSANHNEVDPDNWFQHHEPPALGLADIFDH